MEVRNAGKIKWRNKLVDVIEVESKEVNHNKNQLVDTNIKKNKKKFSLKKMFLVLFILFMTIKKVKIFIAFIIFYIFLGTLWTIDKLIYLFD